MNLNKEIDLFFKNSIGFWWNVKNNRAIDVNETEYTIQQVVYLHVKSKNDEKVMYFPLFNPVPKNVYG